MIIMLILSKYEYKTMEYNNLLVSHLVPWNPGAHWHMNIVTAFIHVAPLRQGPLSQTSTSKSNISQNKTKCERLSLKTGTN